MSAAVLACDWGTTTLRAWTLDAEGKPLASRDFPLGVSRLAPGEAAERFAAEVRPALGAETLPAILCGMVGSNLGWTVAPYVDCPAGLDDLARALVEVAGGPAPIRIVPGVRGPGAVGAPDVMRGEETQVAGWMWADPARARGRHVICHPGTHAKWIVVEEGRIVRFVTAMTGELFSVLGRYSVLKSDAPADDGEAFSAGLAAAGDGGALAARLFSTRSRVAAGEAAPETTPSYLSGLLIGAEIAGVPQLLGISPSDPVALLGDAGLCRAYAQALRGQGVEADTFDGEAAAIAGLFALHRRTERT
jgi:2-dehydro-3-deoxygalactonokinase